jgi:hypothetical protein
LDKYTILIELHFTNTNSVVLIVQVEFKAKVSWRRRCRDFDFAKEDWNPNNLLGHFIAFAIEKGRNRRDRCVGHVGIWKNNRIVVEVESIF